MDVRSDTRSSGFRGQDGRPGLASRIVLAWLGFFGCVLIIGGIVQVATARMPVMISHVAAGLSVAASVLGLVFMLRRHADRRPWWGVGLTLDRAAIPHLVSGMVLATILAAVVGAAVVHLKLADWAWSAGATNESAEQGLASTIIMIALSALLVQGFPEELVFRGYVYRNLGTTLPLWAMVTVSSLIFGSMHVFSNGGATTLGERVLYAVAMTAFGLILAACRTVSGALWLGIGLHGGFDVFNSQFIAIHQGAFIATWLVILGALLAGTAFILAVRQWLAPLDWRAIPGDV